MRAAFLLKKAALFFDRQAPSPRLSPIASRSEKQIKNALDKLMLSRAFTFLRLGLTAGQDTAGQPGGINPNPAGKNYSALVGESS